MQNDNSSNAYTAGGVIALIFGVFGYIFFGEINSYVTKLLIEHTYAWMNGVTICLKDHWEPITSEEGKFTISMPCETTKQAIYEDEITAYFYATQTTSKDYYVVGYMDVPEDFINLNDQSQVEQFLYQIRKFTTEDLNLKVYKKKLVQSPEGLPGREFWQKSEKNEIDFSRFYLVGHRLYILEIIPTSGREQPSSKDKNFFASFERFPKKLKTSDLEKVENKQESTVTEEKKVSPDIEEILRQRAEEDKIRQQQDAAREEERRKRMQGSVDSFTEGTKSVDWYQ